jgi:AcrR family transcriptional regulator
MPIEVRRQQALDAALRMIAERGYGAVTMEAIAREANLAKPVLYNAYPRLGLLLGALLEREQARGLQALAGAMPPHPADDDPAKLLIVWLETLAQAIAAEPDRWRLILTPPEETPEAVRDRVKAGRSVAVTQVRSALERLSERHPALAPDPGLSAEMFVGLAEHGARLLIRDPDEYPPARLIEYARSLLDAVGAAQPSAT